MRHEDTNVVRYVAGALQNLVARLRLTSTHWEQLSYLTELSRSAQRTRTLTLTLTLALILTLQSCRAVRSAHEP